MRRQKWRAAAAAAAISVIGTGIGAGGLTGGKHWMLWQMAHAEETGTTETETMETVPETETEMETETETKEEAGTEAEPGTQNGPETLTEADANDEAELQTDKEEQTEAITDVNTDAETEADTDAETEADTDAETEADTDAETEADTDVETEVQTETDMTAETELQTDQETQTEGTSETEGQQETETEVQTEMETQTEIETETLTEIETEPVTDLETEILLEEESEIVSESESAAESDHVEESETAVESELVGESETAPESETAVETETISETESERVITISSIRIRPGWEEREYDGTDRVELDYDVFVDGQKVSPEEAGILCRARLSSPDAGLRDVDCSFSFSPGETEAGPAVLRTENVCLQANILPRTLTLHIPDAVKEYGAEAAEGNLTMSGEMYAEGFAVDSEGREIIPPDLVLPSLRIDTEKISRFSPMYRNGQICVYEHTLVLCDAQCGNPNYRFSSAAEGGSITITGSRVIEGRDYHLRDPQDGVFRDENGTVWVRRGGSLMIDPAEGSGYNRSVCAENLSESGTFRFSLTASEGGVVTAVSKEAEISYEVDGDVPFAMISTEQMKAQSGVLYGSADAAVTVGIPEDTGSGIKSAVYGFRSLQDGSGGEATGESDCRDGCRITGLGEGSYQLYVRVRDQTGNESVAESMPLTIDVTAPVIGIEGAGDRKAGDGPSGIRVFCRDKNISEEGLQVSVEYTGAGSGNGLKEIRRSRTEGGTELLFVSEKETGAEDGYYILKVKAEDLAGNIAEREAAFTVNRKGSIYSLAQETQSLLETYYHRDPFDIVFEERNISKVKNVQIICSRDGAARTLEEGRDYTVEETAGSDGMHVFAYRIRRSVFLEDGAYEVILMTSDRTGNSSDTTAQNKKIRFVVDRSAPDCLITGISPGGVYMTGELWISLEPMDNAALSCMEVYVNGELKQAAGEQEIADGNGLIRFKLEEDPSWQEVQIRTADKAGNETWSEAIPVFIGKREGSAVPVRETAPEKNTEGSGQKTASADLKASGSMEAAPVVHAGYALTQSAPDMETQTQPRERGKDSIPLFAAVMAGLSTILCILQKKIGVM